ncbi:MAG: hypothetical protein GX790_05070, partial [Syntrophomonadaceae bacterium]|nr:hypothetical protein [Syntrophomonadaceae bacterium]
MKDTLNLRIKVLAIMLVAIIITLISVSVLLGIRDKKIFPSNLVVNGTTLANIQKTEVVDLLHKTYSNQKLILAIPNDLIELDLAECGIELNTEATLEKLDQPDNIPFDNIIYRGAVKEVAPVFNWDEAVLYKVLDRVAIEYSKPAINAQVIYKKHDFTKAIPHEKGYQINKEGLIKAVTKSLADGKLGPITVPFEEIAPQITLNDLQKIKGLIAITNYKNVSLNQTDEHIISVLDNSIILSGDTLSLDELWSSKDINVNYSRISRVLRSLFNNISSQIDIDYDVTTNTISNKMANPILINI